MRAVIIATFLSLLLSPIPLLAQGGHRFEKRPPAKAAPLPQRPAPRPLKPISPQPSGILVEVGRHGLSMFSPLAPEHLGIGEKFLTPNAYPQNYNASDPNRWEQGQREFGGLRLFGFDF
ncbi:hypothetical protein MPNT_20139 [Candidatus Methylacidithermus pantelleriae]|uniref:Uncharacterized protein n=2 Tax=Candidatus Methylacidithermus pantelleriae TaxID=2744239 RepID=A0A8J2FS50_9BACT|nr:hypothetical protein MPNT_20139 [Candidatus Methylacidithermus pantelleriae]